MRSVSCCTIFNVFLSYSQGFVLPFPAAGHSSASLSSLSSPSLSSIVGGACPTSFSFFPSDSSAPRHRSAITRRIRRDKVVTKLWDGDDEEVIPGYPLEGCVALVTGASRGIGRGIALELAFAGATVYVTARSTGNEDCTEGILGGTLASLVQEAKRLQAAGVIRPIKCDHAKDEETYAAIKKIDDEQGRLDLLVNNAFQIPDLDVMVGRRFWEQGAKVWDPLLTVGLRSHYIAACAAAPLLIKTVKKSNAQVVPGIINIGSFGGVSYVFNVAYGVGKQGVDRLSRDMAIELRPKGVACFSLWPGIVMTERMNMIKRNDEEKWMASMGVKEGFTETPRYAGRAVVALAYEGRNPGAGGLIARTGTIQIVAELAREFGFTDIDGWSQPPSIRSLRFLLPNYAAKGFYEYFPGLKFFIPDLRIPLDWMRNGPN